MRLKIGTHNELYSRDVDPALAWAAIRHVVDALRASGITVTPCYTGVKGPDVWFDADGEEAEICQMVAQMEGVGTPTRGVDPQMGEHLALPLILPPQVQRRRR